VNCKNCNIDLDPYYQKKYDGYCLDCINAGADEKDEQTSRMERQLAAAERLYQSLREYAQSMDSPSYPILEDLLTDYANAKGEK